ncbi:V-set and transmembrane domain-containing protein 5 [Paroedura picta]|uniref:V-set and transmembrane domain-containing protein 5 n=1 Tax=Paroedura picta TaxID=143630 RepID=UPI0040568E19
MRPLAGLLWIGTLFLTVGRTRQSELSLYVSQPNLNATVEKNVLLSVAYTAKGVPVIRWKHTAAWGTTKIAEWKPGSYTNISDGYGDRVNVYRNGSLQILKVAMRDSGYYLVTVTEEFGTTIYGTILLNVSEIRYEDLHFVAVCFAFLTAVSAVLICLMWLCNKSLHLFQKERHPLPESATEETELQMIGC